MAASCVALRADGVLNLSHDLTANGIADRDMTPDQPDADSRPLLEAAIRYAQANGITTLIADPGDYYFLTLHNNMTHVLIDHGSNLTIDFQNSELYFKRANRGAIWCTSCSSVILQNFSVDYSQLPFTQVAVTSVDSAARTIRYATIPGYPSPVEFNAARTPDGSDDIEIFIFRDGVPIPETGRINGLLPVTNDTIELGSPGDPWARPARLASIQPGDTVLYTDRGGPHALHFTDSQNCNVHNVSIYSSGSMGLTIPNSSGMTVDHVQIIPKPGTTRLISVNADGIHATYAGANNTFTNNIVRRTGDDSIAFDAPWAATVARAPQGTAVAVLRSATQDFPPGAMLSFIDPKTGVAAGTAQIISENPPYDKQKFSNQEMITLTLDKTPSGVAQGYGVVNLDPSTHGSGSEVSNNLVQEGIFTRGIWLSGVTGMSIHDNFVQRTSKPGIFIQQVNASGVQEGPSSNITIQNNVVDQAIGYGGPSIGPIVAAASIHSVTENDQAAQVTGSPHHNIVVAGNRVTNSSRTAIRLENVNGAEITGNVIQRYGLDPAANVYIIPACCETMTQYVADFMKAILTTNTLGVKVADNPTDGGAALSIGSSASGVPKVAVGSVASATGSRFPANPLVAIIDTAGVSSQAVVLSTSDSKVTFVVPDSVNSGIASIAVGAQSGGVLIDTVAPGLYSANGSGRGVAQAEAVLILPDGTLARQAVSTCGASDGICTANPLDLGDDPTSQLQVTFHGTGFRGYSDVSNAFVRINWTLASIVSLGPSASNAGVDDLSIVVPRTLAGAGEVAIVFTVDGQTANVVTIAIR